MNLLILAPWKNQSQRLQTTEFHEFFWYFDLLSATYLDIIASTPYKLHAVSKLQKISRYIRENNADIFTFLFWSERINSALELYNGVMDAPAKFNWWASSPQDKVDSTLIAL